MARFTLTMPTKIMDDLRSMANKNECNLKEVVRQGLRLVLIGMDAEADDNKKLILEENNQRIELRFLL